LLFALFSFSFSISPQPFGGVQRSHGWAETYIHPKDSGGVLFQFYIEEEPHEHGPEHDHSHSHEMEDGG
jgi:hypothetical protein